MPLLDELLMTDSVTVPLVEPGEVHCRVRPPKLLSTVAVGVPVALIWVNVWPSTFVALVALVAFVASIAEVALAAVIAVVAVVALVA